jgi:hypothetical protein
MMSIGLASRIRAPYTKISFRASQNECDAPSSTHRTSKLRLAIHLILVSMLVSFGSLTVVSASAADSQPSNGKGSEGEDQGHHGGSGVARPDAHAPIGVMGEHAHNKGEFMASYRFMRMNMKGNRDGTDNMKASEVLRPTGTYGVAPLEMTMDMHMLGLMYAPSDTVTLMGMFPFLSLSMDHRAVMGQEFSTDAVGIGDVGAAALIRVLNKDNHQLLINAGMTFPSGSIDRKDVTPASRGASVLLPYPMQTGSGTWDLKPGLTYQGRLPNFSWGGQAMGTIRLGRNDEDYRLGNNYHLTGWGGWKALDWMSISARVEWRQWFNIEGNDSRYPAPPVPPAGPPFNSMADFVPTADPDLRAGKRVDIGPSVNFIIPSSKLKRMRLAFEMLFPVYQDLDGPQLKNDWTMTVGTQYDW